MFLIELTFKNRNLETRQWAINKILDYFLMDKTMADKLMYIPIDDTQNYRFCRSKLVDETFKHLT